MAFLHPTIDKVMHTQDTVCQFGLNNDEFKHLIKKVDDDNRDALGNTNTFFCADGNEYSVPEEVWDTLSIFFGG